MNRSLQRLLKPKSIAVIGGKEAMAVIVQAIAMGFDGAIWPVHPNKTKVCGFKAYSSVLDLPHVPDAAYVAVNRQRTIDIVADLAGIGAGGAICYASGFGEADATGRNLERALSVAAGEMPLIGPNCYGLLNYVDGVALWPDQHGGKRLRKGQSGVAIITQSSNIAINLTMQQRGLPIAYVMTVGNQIQTGLSDLALTLLDDPQVSALGLHIEGFDTIKGMEAVARKSRKLKKPIVALKIGRSDQAKKAAFTHTAALSGEDAAADAFLRRVGIARVNSLSSFLETLKLLHLVGPLKGYSISSLSCSGGEAGLMADAIMDRKIYCRELSLEEKKPIEKALGPMVSVSNPLDYHTYIWGNGQGMEAVFAGMMNAGFDLNCLVMDFPREGRCSDADWKISVDAWVSAATKCDAKTCIIATLHENISETQALSLIERGVVPLNGIDEAFDAMEAAADIGAAWQRAEFLPVIVPSALSDMKQKILDEYEGKKLLKRYGISVPNGGCCKDLDKISTVTEKIGFPVVLKVLGIAHKSEKNAVRLNLDDIQSTRCAAEELIVLGDELYVEAMVKKPVLELLVGVMHDAQFGLVMTIASGGVMVEVFKDSQTLLLPFDKSEVEVALRRLKIAVLFDGFRGGQKADFDAAVEAILCVQKFVFDNRDCLDELDINPLIVCEKGHGAVAADVLIKFGREG